MPMQLGESKVVYRLDPTRSHDVPERHFGVRANGRPLFGLQGHAASENGHDQAGILLGARSTRFHRGSQAVEELADEKLRVPCRKVLESLQVHWAGLTLLVDDPRIPLDNNASERKVRGPALGRKNYYGSGALWSGRLSAMMFSILATLSHWRINPRHWLMWYLKTCAASGGKAPSDVSPFLPWNLTTDQLASLRAADPRADQPTA